MFVKRKKNVTGSSGERPATQTVKAFLGSGSRFEGSVTLSESLRIDGTFKGEITSRFTLVVGDTADIQAEIEVDELIVSGRIRGNIRAGKRVELRAPACVQGDIEAPSVAIEDGVIFNGRVTMSTGVKRREIENQLIDLAVAS